MKPVIRLACFLSVVACAAGAWAQKTSPLEQEFSKLREEYFKVEKAYYKPLEDAKSNEQLNKVRLDPEKHPAKAYLGKFKALAKKMGKKEVAVQAWFMVMRLSAGADGGKTVEEAVSVLMRDFVASPQMGEFAASLRYHFYLLEQPVRKAKIDGLLYAIETKNPHRDVQAKALYLRGAQKTWDDPVFARKLFARVVEKYPDAPEAARAKLDIYEIDHLSVGKAALDFDATDQDGIAFKLSDYRGKVVVLEFWGFW